MASSGGFSPRQETRAYAARYSNTEWAQHAHLSGGMYRDAVPVEIPEGGCWDALNMLCDKPGVIRKRGGYSSPAITSRTATSSQLGSFRSGSIDALTGLVGVLGNAAGASVNVISRVTGAPTALAIVASGGAVGSLGSQIMAKPFQHRSYMVLPVRNNDGLLGTINTLCFWGGSTAASQGGANGTVVAGSNQITGLASGTLTSANVGQFIYISNPGTPQYYLGRIVSRLGPTSVQVEPTPTVGFTGTSWGSFSLWAPDSGIGSNYSVPVGKYAVSYQGRIVQANIASTLGAPSFGAIEMAPYDVIWGKLQSESLGSQYDGEQMLFPFGTSNTFNRISIPAAGEITGLAIAGEGTLLVFSKDRTFRVSGQLNNETALNPTPLYSQTQISQTVGCIEARSIAYTSRGIIFAAADNLYVYDGAAMHSVLTDKNENYYQARLAAGDVIRGAAYIANTNHYYLSMSGSDGGMMLNLSDLGLTRQANIVIADSAPDPTDSTQVWGLKWWDTTGAAPSQVAGPILGLKSLFVTASTNVNDGDGTAVLATFQSRPYAEMGLETIARFRQLKMLYDLRYAAGTATLTVSVDTVLDPLDASYVTASSTVPETTIASLANFQIGPLVKKGQALQIKVAMNGVADRFELMSFDVGFQPLRQGRAA